MALINVIQIVSRHQTWPEAPRASKWQGKTDAAHMEGPVCQLGRDRKRKIDRTINKMNINKAVKDSIHSVTGELAYMICLSVGLSCVSYYSL